MYDFYIHMQVFRTCLWIKEVKLISQKLHIYLTSYENLNIVPVHVAYLNLSIKETPLNSVFFWNSLHHKSEY